DWIPIDHGACPVVKQEVQLTAETVRDVKPLICIRGKQGRLNILIMVADMRHRKAEMANNLLKEDVEGQPIDKAVGTNIGLPMGNTIPKGTPFTEHLPTECRKRGTAKLQITGANVDGVDPYSLKTCDILEMIYENRDRQTRQLSKDEAETSCSSNQDEGETSCINRHILQAQTNNDEDERPSSGEARVQQRKRIIQRRVQQKQKDQEDEVFGRILSAKKMKSYYCWFKITAVGEKVNAAESLLVSTEVNAD
ncbi:hypothetical protein Tco_0761862, partial [Tanacetum coccineum]